MIANGENAVARLGAEEAEPLRELGGHEVAQRHVVGQQEEADVPVGLLAARALRGVAEDDANLGLEIEAPGLVAQDDVVGRAEEDAGAALVHQRIGRQRLGGSAPRALRTSTMWWMYAEPSIHS